MLEFGFNVTERVVEIEILPDEDRNEMREAFTLHITPDQMMIADVQVSIPHKVLGSRPRLAAANYFSLKIIRY